MLEKQFQNPPSICRGTDFWMLNDKLDNKELVRQMRSMREQNIMSIIARTYLGLQSDYPGKDWMEKMHVIVDTAKELGMTVFMQAGYMPNAVLGLPDHLSLANIRRCPAGQGEGKVLHTHNGVDYCLEFSHIILDMLSPEASAFYVHQSYDLWAEFSDEYGKTIPSVWVDEPAFGHVSLPWTQRLPETYQALWGEAFPMNQLHLLVEDGEGAQLLRLRYWRTILHLLKNGYFKAIRDWGEQHGVMISGHLMDEDTMEMQIGATCFTMPLYHFFDIPGIDYLTADMPWQHGEIKHGYLADDMRWPRFAAYNTPIQCSSAAHQYGQNIVLAEMYGVSTENLNLRDQKQMFDHFASLGINHRSIHGIFYSLRGRAKRAYPPHLSDYQPYWPKYHLLTDALARETAFVRSGKPVRDAVVLHPMETAFSLYHCSDVNDKKDNHQLKRLDQAFNQLIRSLVGMQLGFDLGDEDTIADLGSVTSDGSMRIGEMTYPTVILPNMQIIRRSTLCLLEEVIRRGGRVVSFGELPRLTDDGQICSLPGAAVVHSLRALQEYLQAGSLHYTFESKENTTGVQIYCRQEGEELHFFLTNVHLYESAVGTLCVPERWQTDRFMEADGSIQPYPGIYTAEQTRIPVELPAGGTMLLRLRRGEPMGQAEPAPKAMLPLTKPWHISRKDPNVLLLESFRYAREGEELTAESYPILAIQELLRKEDYHGQLRLATDFTLARPMDGLRLALEYPSQQQLTIDGIPLCMEPVGYYRTYGFETIHLPKLDKGTHRLAVSRHFEPRRKATNNMTALFETLGGVDLEQMLLLGDFAVYSSVEPTIRGCVRLGDDFVLDAEHQTAGNELIHAGYPFYAGVMDLSTRVVLPDDARNVKLRLEALNAAAAEVFVNDKSCGNLSWAPYEAALTNLQPGENTITIRLFGTMRNLLGPWHRTLGEMGEAFGSYIEPNRPWMGSYANENAQYYPDWYTDRKPDRIGWTDSYLLVPYGLVDAALTWDI